MKIFFYNKWHRNYFIRRYIYGPILKYISYLFYMLYKAFRIKLGKLNSPIFIIGCSRSGTTMFMENFCKHSDLCNWSEAAQIMELNFYNEEIDHYKIKEDASSFDEFRINSLFFLKTYINGKSRFINKHPENSIRIEFIQKIFPDAIFIHFIRDGRAVVASNYDKTLREPFRVDWPFGQFPKPIKWRSYMQMSSVSKFSHQWVDILSYIQDYNFSDENYIEITYESFCNDPHKILSVLDNFCALDSSGRDFTNIPTKFTPRNDKWKVRFTPNQITEVNNIISSLNKKLDYK